MIVYPAIDIRGGQAVRLVEGDFARETTFDADPVDAAIRWAAAGATWLHIVDLDGAVAGHPVNLDVVRRIRSAVAVKLQLGGGMRRERDVEAAFAAGIDRAVLGTAAASDDETVRRCVARWPGAIAAGLDARDGKLATKGWLEQTGITVAAAAERLRELGVTTLIYTDIRRDGTLTGPDLAGLMELVSRWGPRLIASGGVGSIADIDALAATGVEGAIIGRALYDGRIDLGEAMRRAERAVAR